MTGKDKHRLDQALVDLGLAENKSRARALIMSGSVLVDGEVKDKPGLQFPAGVTVTLKDKLPYVSRGGLKLEAALDRFGVDPSGRICLDAGASTGGFTDCLLKRGAKKVYAVDVGKGQLDWGLRNDPRVVVLEQVNARGLKPDDVPERIGLATADVSFISLKLVLPAMALLLSDDADVIALVKPQFEAGRDKVGKGGVVRDEKVIKDCVDSVSTFARSIGLEEKGRMESPVKGPKGNREQLLWLRRSGA